MLWIIMAVLSALFAGLTSILAKCGIRKTDSDVATAIRTIVVLIFSWIMAFIVGSATTITQIAPRSLLFLILSGLATGGSWLCYYYAIQNGVVSKATKSPHKSGNGVARNGLLHNLYIKTSLCGCR